MKLHASLGAGRAAWLLLASALCLGCEAGEDELPRESVSGRVTLDEAPLAKGWIMFSPAGGAGTQVGGEVSDGAYAIAKAQGPVPGSYVVMITAGGTLDGDPDDPAKRPTAKDRLKATDPVPNRYNTRTTLKAEVKAGGPNTLDFPLSTK